MGEIQSFRDLRVYQKLFALHIEVHNLSLTFPKFETYELGSQVRRSSNSAPAQIAEGWGSRHTNIYLESVSRALGEVRETQHHLAVAQAKGYLSREQHKGLDEGYDHCGRMLERLYQSLSEWRGSVRYPTQVKEEPALYLSSAALLSDWEEVVGITFSVMAAPDNRPPTTDNR
jgi:four helix bundle protein